MVPPQQLGQLSHGRIPGGCGSGHTLQPLEEFRLRRLLRPFQVDGDPVVVKRDCGQLEQPNHIPNKRTIREFEALVIGPDPVRQFIQTDGIAIQQDLQDSQLAVRQDPAAGTAELSEQRSGEFPEQRALMVGGDGRGYCAALLGDRL